MNAGCGFLSPAEVEAAIEGRLDEARAGEFDRHVEAGCAECVMLAADLDVFCQVAHGELMEGERRESDRQAEMLRVRLKREVGKTRPVPAWRGWVVAAAAVLLAGFGWIGLRGPGGVDGLTISIPGGETIVAEARRFKRPPILRGDRNLDDLWSDAEAAYTTGRFAGAARSLVEIVEQDPDSFDALLYLGICRLALERPDEAGETLERARALAVEQDLSTESLAWFQALTALSVEDRTAAEAFLREAAAGSGNHARKARELLVRLPD